MCKCWAGYSWVASDSTISLCLCDFICNLNGTGPLKFLSQSSQKYSFLVLLVAGLEMGGGRNNSLFTTIVPIRKQRCLYLLYAETYTYGWASFLGGRPNPFPSRKECSCACISARCFRSFSRSSIAFSSSHGRVYGQGNSIVDYCQRQQRREGGRDRLLSSMRKVAE